MENKQSLREYWKLNLFTAFFGFGGSVWGGLTYFIGIPVAYLTFLKASSMQIGLITAIFWACFAVPQIWAAYNSEAKLIKKHFPNIKVIACIRNPVDMIYSSFWWTKALGDGIDFEDTFEEHIRINPEYLKITLFSEQLKPYFKHFKTEQPLITCSSRYVT